MIKQAEITDLTALSQLAIHMWHDSTISELEEDFKEVITNDNAVVFIKLADKKLI